MGSEFGIGPFGHGPAETTATNTQRLTVRQSDVSDEPLSADLDAAIESFNDIDGQLLTADLESTIASFADDLVASSPSPRRT